MKQFLYRHYLICTVIAFAVIFGICTVIAVNFSKSFQVFIDFDPAKVLQEVAVTVDGEMPDADSIISVGKIEEYGNYVRVDLQSRREGMARVAVQCKLIDAENSRETKVKQYDMTVGRWGMIFTGAGLSNYSGLPIYYFAVAIFSALMVAYYFWIFREVAKTRRYCYQSVKIGAVALFFLIVFIGYSIIFWVAMARLHILDAALLSQLTENIMGAIILGSSPFILIFAVLISISNIALMRHEGIRPVNALGIIAGMLLLLGVGAVSVLLLLNLQHGLEQKAAVIAYSVGASLMVIFEVLLLSSMICGICAAKHRPAFDKDFIIILGCGIRPDGTLYPLLQGRVDRAVAFYREQFQRTGKKAVLVPSGGKGDDEIISEGEAMERYLRAQDIPENDILPETRSTTTLENMQFSGKLIKARKADAKIAFATTNFHVFRSGIFAAEAGLDAEGMGSKTKWYFWPNAFLREIAAVFLSQPKRQLLIIGLTVIFAGLAGYGYSLIG